MGEVIYKKEFIRKVELYSFIKKLFTDNGWEDISSRPADGEVFYSKGTSGEDELYVNIKDWETSMTANLASTGSQIMTRTLKSYTPGNKGSAGTIPSGSMGFADTRIGDNSNYIMEFIYYADADKVTFFIKRPAVTGNYTSYHYYGKPDYVGRCEESKYAIAFCSFVDDVENIRHPWNGFTEAPFAPVILMHNNPLAKDAGGKFILNNLSFSDTVSDMGLLGKFDGVYTMTRDASLMPFEYDKFDGHKLIAGDKMFETILLRTTNTGWQNMPYYALAYRIE